MHRGYTAAMKTAPLLLAALALIAGCASTSPSAHRGITYAKLGQTVHLGGPWVTPLAVVEDSRCPTGVACVWAGRLRISARIGLGSGSEMRELTLGEAQQVADGSLELVEATPHPTAKRHVEPGDYRFGFVFSGGR
jgi:hypothetical protein